MRIKNDKVALKGGEGGGTGLTNTGLSPWRKLFLSQPKSQW